MIVGIDPGETTGFAFYEDGKLVELKSVSMSYLFDELESKKITTICLEDSRIQSKLWFNDRQSKMSVEAKLSIARDVGRIDCLCALVARWCGKNSIPVIMISPKGKGKKLDADEFKKITGWSSKSNQHVRDAAMVAWPYRYGVKVS